MAPHEAPTTAPQQGVAVDFAQPGVAIVALFGEHDLSGKPRLNDALAAASVRLNVLVDLSACTFIDSSVIGALFAARSRLAERGGRLELVIPPEATAVRRVADLTMLGSLLTIHEDCTTGCAGFSAEA
jgi:anti-sigma B factor antagonist